MSTQEVFRTGCCEPFDPALWQGKEITWKDKIFVKDEVKCLMLVDEKSAWGEDLYIDVSKEVPGAEMTTMSGTFLTKVFEGPYQNAGKWAEEMTEYVKTEAVKLLRRLERQGETHK